MSYFIGFKCVGCGANHKPEATEYVCPACGANLQVTYDYAAIRRDIKRDSLLTNNDRSIWRYFPLLPLEKAEFRSPLSVGWTPLYRSKNLAASLGLKNLHIKDDGRNPSASFKDRAGAVALARALERGERLITGASTGNAASSLACLASVAGMKTVIFVPQTAPVAKIAQLLVFGATVVTVKGTYDQAFDLSLQATREYGWYNRNTGYNPFTREGKKTCAFEIAEQLGWKAPDKVIVPVGDGNILTGIWKGFCDLVELGWLDRAPQLVAVQAEGSNAIAQACAGDGKIRPVSGETVADSISVSVPRDGVAAVQAIRESGGFAVTVSDQEILEAIPTLARLEGVFAEPAAASSVAGLKKAVRQGRIAPHETVVTLITGSGLKDVASAMKAVGKPFIIEPSLEALKTLNLGA